MLFGLRMYAIVSWFLVVAVGVAVSYHASRLIGSQLPITTDDQSDINATSSSAATHEEFFHQISPSEIAVRTELLDNADNADSVLSDASGQENEQDTAVEMNEMSVDDDINNNNNNRREEAKQDLLLVEKLPIAPAVADKPPPATTTPKLLSPLLPPTTEANNGDQRSSYAELYKQGQEAYLASDFQTCAMRMLHALDEHDAFKHREALCKRRCNNGHGKKTKDKLEMPKLNEHSPLRDMIEHNRKQQNDEDDSLDYTTLELQYLRSALYHTSCLLSCHAELEHHASAISLDVDKEFESLMPLDYLQICLFNIGNHAEAANIAYTFLMRHPTHEIMAANLKFYVEKNGIKAEQIVNRKRRAYEDSYYTAMDAYNAGDFSRAAQVFELALEEYYTAEANCRAECDGHAVATNSDISSSTYNYDLVWTITNKLITALHCRQNCAKLLSFFDAKDHPKLLSSLYNYLQFSYFKAGDIAASCAALESYRLFEPNDADAQNNEIVLERDYGAKLEWYRARDEATAFVMRSEAEKEILYEMHELFGDESKTQRQSNTLDAKEEKYAKGEHGGT